MPIGRLGTWALAAPVAVLLLAVPADSPAGVTFGCGGVRSATATRHHGHERPPLAIGDSTMLLALYDLAAVGYDANAHGCRQFPEALALLQRLRAEHYLPHMVLIALGADGTLPADGIGRALGLLCCTRLLVLVTPRELGGGAGADAATVRAEARRHPARVLVLDWVAYSAGHGSWFQPDGLHLTISGAEAFTHFLARAMPDAYPPPRNPHGRTS